MFYVQHTFSDGVLTIDDVTPDDSGRYECVASNKAGTSSAFAMLTVQSRLVWCFTLVFVLSSL